MLDLDGIAHALDEKARRNGDSYSFRCLHHGDTHPSASVSLSADGSRLLIFCHRCASVGASSEAVYMTHIEHLKRTAPHLLPEMPNTRRVTARADRVMPATIREPDPLPEVAPPGAADPDWRRAAPEGHRFIACWRYTTAAGDTLALVARFDDAQGRKTIRPYRWLSGKWSAKGLPDKRPLWNLKRITDNPGHAVVIVEGEKCAAALEAEIVRRRLPAIATTWIGGAAAVAKTDFNTLAGRRVSIWPDNDLPGFVAASKIAEIVTAAGASSVNFIVPTLDEPQGWDAADALADPGFDLVAFVSAHKMAELPVREIEHTPEIPPHFLEHPPAEDHPLDRGMTGVELLEPDPTDSVIDLLARRKSQDAVAAAYEHQFKGKLKFTAGVGLWSVWDGKRWAYERTGIALHYARLLSRAMNREGTKTMESAGFMSGVERLASISPTFAVLPAVWDADNYLLNTPGGTIDLRTGEMRPHEQSQMLSKMTAVAPSLEGGARFRRFMREVCCDDTSLVDFLQRALGSMLSGAIEEHWLMFWIGTGRNGKNTLGDLVMHILGDYAKQVPSETLMTRAHGTPHPTELANLMGCRLAASSEVSEGAHWDDGRLKSLTGDAMISARFMRQDFFEFRRTHKHLIYGNHRPQLRSIEPALRSRMKIVPFRADFNGREDADLPRVLMSEAPYVLHWLIEGHLKWLEDGKRLRSCAAVDTESADYFSSQSTVEAWLEERCVLIECDERPQRLLPSSSTLYADYSEWKKARGEHPVSATRFGETMARQPGLERIRTSGPMVWRGLTLRLREVGIGPGVAD